MAKRVSPFVIRQQSGQLAKQVEIGALTDKQAIKKLGGLMARKGK